MKDTLFGWEPRLPLPAHHQVQHIITYDHGLFVDHDSSAAEVAQFVEADANARLIAAAPYLLEAGDTLCDAIGTYFETAMIPAYVRDPVKRLARRAHQDDKPLNFWHVYDPR